jgi:hypothetical protein
MVYIPDNYGMILSRYWSTMLNGYISINWSLLRIPFNGKLITTNRESYIKHVVIDLNDPNEPVVNAL